MDNCALEAPYRGAATTPEEVEEIAAISLRESLEKETRLLKFYEQPFGANAGPWHLPRIHWQYLREFKPVGQKRKDEATEDIIHELNPALEMAAYFKADFLPSEVTYERIGGIKRDLPLEQRSIAHLFSAIAFHDRDEDDPDASRETLIEFSNDNISALGKVVSEVEKDFMRRQVLYLADVSDALTFGRKARMADGSVQKQKTHGDDLALYNRALTQYWTSITTKCPDRIRGLATRYTRVPIGKFTIDKHMAYLNETGTIFMEAQPIEDTMDRFPQLTPFLEIMNSQMRAAFVTVGAMTKYHPNLDIKQHSRKGVYNPETAEISIHRALKTAMRAAEWIPHDVCAMTELLEGLKAEAERERALQPLVDRIEEQLTPYLQHLGACPKPNCSQRRIR